MSRLRFALLLALAPALCAQYSVTSLADAGNGTLRDALERIAAAAPASATVTLELPGTCRLTSRALPVLPVTTRLSIVARNFGPGARFTIDAGPISGSPQNGLWLRAPDSQVSAPLTILLDQGTALRISADRIRCEDVEVRVQNGTGVLIEAVRETRLSTVTVQRATTGIHLRQAFGAVAGERSSGGRVTIADCSAQGVLVDQGSWHRIEQFRIDRCRVGVHAITTTDLQLGDAAGARSHARSCAVDGVQLERSQRVRLEHADCDDNQAAGVALNGGAALTVTGVAAARNAVHGFVARLAAANLTLGPGIAATATGGGFGEGLRLYGVTDVTVQGANLGPGNRVGLSISNDGAFEKPTRVVASGCRMTGNDDGVYVFDARETTIADCTIDDNTGFGVRFVDTPAPVLRGSSICRNPSGGVHVLRCDRCAIGPGNRVEDSLGGISLFDSVECTIAGNGPIARCKSTGIQLIRSPRSWIAQNGIADTLGLGILVLHSSNQCVIGPGNLVLGTVGTAIKVETSSEATLLRNIVHGLDGRGLPVTTVGIACIAGDPALPRTHLLRSNLIIAARDIGVLARACDPVRVELCTIVNGGRGVLAAGGSSAVPVRIDLDSTILWGNALGDWTTQPQFYEFVSANYCIQQSPLGTGTNRTVDPQFADPGVLDFRLRPASPAVDGGNGSLAIGAGEADLAGNPRRSGARVDAGALESGAPPAARLELLPATMPAGGGLVDFRIYMPVADAGKKSLLLFNLSGPGQPWNVFGQPFPLPLDPWMAVTLTVPAPIHQNTLATIAPDGSVSGRIDYRGLLPPAPPFSIWCCAIAFDPFAARATTVTNVAQIQVR